MGKTVPGRPKGPPPVWNLFQRRNIHFVGQRSICRRWNTAWPFRRRSGRGRWWAQGGSGKTALAVEYAYSHQDQYDIVWWIRADTQATIVTDLAGLAAKLARSGQIFDSPRQACAAAIDELQRRDRWLLIFDNARKPEDLASFLPAKAIGHVLITSGNSNWESLASILPVNSWSRNESIEFLRLRLGGIDDLHVADQLAAALGDLPLAIEQAATSPASS